MDILTVAREHLSEALNDPVHELPDYGPRWGTLAAWCRQNTDFRSIAEAIHFAQTPTGHGGFEARLTGESLVQNAEMMEAILLRDFPRAACHFNSFVEPEISRPDQTMVYKGRRISSPLPAHMLFYFSCATRVPDMDCVCEIGGGFGAPARLFLTNSFRRPSTYVIVDLPESLYLAELYLHATLGGDRIQYVQPGARLDLTNGGVILCPVGRLSTLKSIRFDLVLNTLSAQEMTDEYVAFYRNWLDEQHASYFYSFNYLMQSVFDRTESANAFAPRLSEHWDIVWSATMGERPYLCAHVLAKRTNPLNIDERNRMAIERHFRRPLGINSVYPLLHVAETSSDARFPYRLMAALADDFEFRPKEIFFLAELIEAIDLRRPVLTLAERQRVRDLRAEVTNRSHVARVPPHLVGMQQGLYAQEELGASRRTPTPG